MIRYTNVNKNSIIYLLKHDIVRSISAVKFDKTSEFKISFLKLSLVIYVKRQITSTLAIYCFSCMKTSYLVAKPLLHLRILLLFPLNFVFHFPHSSIFFLVLRTFRSLFQLLLCIVSGTSKHNVVGKTTSIKAWSILNHILTIRDPVEGNFAQTYLLCP